MNNYFDLFFKILSHTERNSPKKINQHPETLLQLSPIEVNEDYLEKWNEISRDFLCLTKNGELVNNTLYRTGAYSPDLKDDYFILLKYSEAQYSKEIMKMSKSKNANHLRSNWCIIDKHGNEKVVAPEFRNIYLVKNSIIYSQDSKYYNIETGELYCYASKSMESDDFLFLEGGYGTDEPKRGVMQINKKDGTFIVHPKK